MNTLAKALAVVALFSLATAFVPSSTNAPVKSSPTAQYALADRIFGMDLFAPKKDQNDYGARNAKNVKVGKITDKSYIPAGLTKAQYEKVRLDADKKKQENYQRNVKKAGESRRPQPHLWIVGLYLEMLLTVSFLSLLLARCIHGLH
jgi:hypothetical protein